MSRFCYFCLMTQLPPTSTLFPYTTLFRSKQSRKAELSLTGDGDALPPRRRDGRASDRKSTRLNSSHLGISYAVFCLKKKKGDRRDVQRLDHVPAGNVEYRQGHDMLEAARD